MSFFNSINYTWTSPYKKLGLNKSGVARWLSIIRYLNNVNEASKEEIVKAVWGYSKSDFDRTWGRYSTNTFRGWQSTLFANMHEDNLIVYNSKTRKWSLGDYGCILNERYAA